jgi:hypothetical protein
MFDMLLSLKQNLVRKSKEKRWDKKTLSLCNDQQPRKQDAHLIWAFTKVKLNHDMGTLFKQIIGIPMGTNCAPQVADLFLYCYERDFMLSLSEDKQQDVIVAFNNTSIYLDDIFNLDNPYFDQMVSDIYPHELQLNKTLEILVHHF